MQTFLCYYGGPITGYSKAEIDSLLSTQYGTQKVIRSVASTTTLLSTDEIVSVDNSGSLTVTLPPLTGRIVNGKTRELVVKKKNPTGTVSITPQSGETIEGQSSFALEDSLTPSLTIVADPFTATNWMII